MDDIIDTDAGRNENCYTEPGQWAVDWLLELSKILNCEVLRFAYLVPLRRRSVYRAERSLSRSCALTKNLETLGHYLLTLEYD